MSYNVASGNGGALHFESVAAATLRDVNATANKAGAAGGAMAVVESTRSRITLADSSMLRNSGLRGGALLVQDSDMGVKGVKFDSNSATAGDGGAVASSGADTLLSFSDPPCVNVNVLLDWTTAGGGCPSYPQFYGGTCDLMTFLQNWDCATVEAIFGISCSGCACDVK